MMVHDSYIGIMIFFIGVWIDANSNGILENNNKDFKLSDKGNS